MKTKKYIFVSALFISLALLASPALAVTKSVDHTLTGSYLIPGGSYSTGWRGGCVGSYCAYFSFDITAGLSKATLEMDGTLTADFNKTAGDTYAGSLYFTPGAYGTASMNQGFQSDAQYKFTRPNKAPITGSIEFLTRDFLFNDSRAVSPYFLGYSVTLSDRFDNQKVVSWRIPAIAYPEVSFDISIKSAVAQSTITGQNLGVGYTLFHSPYYASSTITNEADTVDITLEKSYLVVNNSWQQSTMDWRADYTLGASVCVRGFIIKECIPLATIGPFTKDNPPRTFKAYANNPHIFYFREYFGDSDGDGYGDALDSLIPDQPLPPYGYVTNADDCDDSNSSVFPGAGELLGNNSDDNCDGNVDESIFCRDSDGDGHGNPADTTTDVTPPGGYVVACDDCDDGNGAVHPDAAEVANAADDNCNGVTDEGLNTYYRDADGDGYGKPNEIALGGDTPPAGYVAIAGDCDDRIPAVHPGATEVCNFRDDDCDGFRDEGVTRLYYRDADGDGYGSSSVPAVSACDVCIPRRLELVTASAQPGDKSICRDLGRSTNNLDCDDSRPDINPQAQESCATLYDDDCDGEANEVCHPPSARGGSFVTDEDSPVDVQLVASDVDGDDLSFSLLAQPAHGTLSGSNPALTYMPNADYFGTDSFSFSAYDGYYSSSPATVSITVNPVNDAPVADAGADQELIVDALCQAGTYLDGSGSYDADGDPLAYAWSWEGGTASGQTPLVSFTEGTYVIELGVTEYTPSSLSDTDNTLVTARDVTPPGLTPPVDVVAECAGTLGQPVDIGVGTETVSDNCCLSGTTHEEYGVYYPGDTPVLWTAYDCSGNASSATQYVTVQDTTPPLLTPPPDVTVECTGPGGMAVPVGTATASDVCTDTVAITNNAPALFYAGQTPVVWTATDGNGLSSAATQYVTVQDTAAPALSVSVSPAVLWPPKHNMVEVFPVVETSDVCCDAIDVTYTVTMTEGDVEDTFDPLYDVDPDSGFIGEDIQIVGGHIYVRAERSGSSSSGRQYIITYTATDCNGNASAATATVLVPHDQR